MDESLIWIFGLAAAFFGFLLIIGIIIYFNDKKDAKQPGKTVQTVTASITQPVPRVPAGSQTLDIIIISMLVIEAIFWLSISGLQLFVGSFTLSEGGLGTICAGIWNLVMAVLGFAIIYSVVKKKKAAITQLGLLSILGIAWGLFQLFTGAALQGCIIPVYAVIGVLTYMNRTQYVL